MWPATGPAPAAGGLVADVAVGQRLLQFGDARAGNLGLEELELLEVGQAF